ncbi:hypothetical protein T459_16140 [Capsicum annuum]|uniref:AIPP2-like SPOC-like domain-containing protein n=1 Tax=Capsicum annuum TaxID=4072 RepID=A0A2G2Z7V2_CAPAN|nr:hypothetical protein T459_16140 [Capsicum annuum]
MERKGKERLFLVRGGGYNVLGSKYCVLAYYDAAPRDWCCDDCEKGKGVLSLSRRLENRYSHGSKLHAPAKIFLSTVPPKKLGKFPGGHCINWEKEVTTGKTRYIPVEESLGLLSGIEKSTSSSRVVSTKSMETITQGNFGKYQAQCSRSFPEKSTAQWSLGSEGYTKSQNLKKAKITAKSKEPVQSSKGLGGSINLERRSPHVVNESGIIPMPHRCDPALVPSWKGSFDILGTLPSVSGMLNNCIQAHPPSRIRRKVYEFSRKLPETLKFEVLPRENIWTSLFNDHSPGKEDIGMYFFASERERSEKYIALVESMSINDLVMRTLIYDVELLILPSTALCSDYQIHFEISKVFCSSIAQVSSDLPIVQQFPERKVPALHTPSVLTCCHRGSNKVIDMEINVIRREDVCTANEVDVENNENEVEMEVDMIDGENIGILGIVVSTTTRNGFGSSLKETVSAATCNGSESVYTFNIC